MRKNKIQIPNISRHIREAEISELKSLVDSILKEKIYLSIAELRHLLNKELNIQVLTNEEVNELVAPIKKYIIN